MSRPESRQLTGQEISGLLHTAVQNAVSYLSTQYAFLDSDESITNQVLQIIEYSETLQPAIRNCISAACKIAMCAEKLKALSEAEEGSVTQSDLVAMLSVFGNICMLAGAKDDLFCKEFRNKFEALEIENASLLSQGVFSEKVAEAIYQTLRTVPGREWNKFVFVIGENGHLNPHRIVSSEDEHEFTPEMLRSVETEHEFMAAVSPEFQKLNLITTEISDDLRKQVVAKKPQDGVRKANEKWRSSGESGEEREFRTQFQTDVVNAPLKTVRDVVVSIEKCISNVGAALRKNSETEMRKSLEIARSTFLRLEANIRVALESLPSISNIVSLQATLAKVRAGAAAVSQSLEKLWAMETLLGEEGSAERTRLEVAKKALDDEDYPEKLGAAADELRDAFYPDDPILAVEKWLKISPPILEIENTVKQFVFNAKEKIQEIKKWEELAEKMAKSENATKKVLATNILSVLKNLPENLLQLKAEILEEFEYFQFTEGLAGVRSRMASLPDRAFIQHPRTEVRDAWRIYQAILEYENAKTDTERATAISILQAIYHRVEKAEKNSSLKKILEPYHIILHIEDEIALEKVHFIALQRAHMEFLRDKYHDHTINNLQDGIAVALEFGEEKIFEDLMTSRGFEVVDARISGTEIAREGTVLLEEQLVDEADASSESVIAHDQQSEAIQREAIQRETQELEKRIRQNPALLRCFEKIKASAEQAMRAELQKEEGERDKSQDEKNLQDAILYAVPALMRKILKDVEGVKTGYQQKNYFEDVDIQNYLQQLYLRDLQLGFWIKVPSGAAVSRPEDVSFDDRLSEDAEDPLVFSVQKRAEEVVSKAEVRVRQAKQGVSEAEEELDDRESRPIDNSEARAYIEYLQGELSRAKAELATAEVELTETKRQAEKATKTAAVELKERLRSAMQSAVAEYKIKILPNLPTVDQIKKFCTSLVVLPEPEQKILLEAALKKSFHEAKDDAGRKAVLMKWCNAVIALNENPTKAIAEKLFAMLKEKITWCVFPIKLNDFKVENIQYILNLSGLKLENPENVSGKEASRLMKNLSGIDVASRQAEIQKAAAIEKESTACIAALLPWKQACEKYLQKAVGYDPNKPMLEQYAELIKKAKGFFKDRTENVAAACEIIMMVEKLIGRPDELVKAETDIALKRFVALADESRLRNQSTFRKKSDFVKQLDAAGTLPTATPVDVVIPDTRRVSFAEKHTALVVAAASRPEEIEDTHMPLGPASVWVEPVQSPVPLAPERMKTGGVTRRDRVLGGRRGVQGGVEETKDDRHKI